MATTPSPRRDHRRLLIVAGLLVGIAGGGAIATAVLYEPAEPSECEVLLRQAEHSSDVGVLLVEAGCVEPTPTGHGLTVQP